MKGCVGSMKAKRKIEKQNEKMNKKGRLHIHIT